MNSTHTKNSEAKHTPGPWTTNGADSLVDDGGTQSERMHGIYATYNPKTAGLVGYAATEGDARLMAAAPGLLCMLQRLLAEVECSDIARERIALLTLEQARAAIAKATGGAL